MDGDEKDKLRDRSYMGAWMRLAAEIVRSGRATNDQRFLNSEWCQELTEGVSEWCRERLERRYGISSAEYVPR